MRFHHRAHGAIVALLVALVVLSGCSGEATRIVADPVPTPTPSATPLPVDGPAIPGPRHVGLPTRVSIPAIGVDEALHGVGLKADGAMQTPAFGDAGWFEPGPRPGARGPAVIVAHVHGPDGDDVFADLADLVPGDRIRVDRTDGATVFVVESVEQSLKEELPTRRIWNRTTAAELRLITCGGVPDPVTRMYPENTVVYAHAVRSTRTGG